MITRKQINIFVLLTVLIWLSINYLSGNALSYDILKPFASTAGILVVLYNLFDLYIWKFPYINPYIVKRPDISGTWQIKLISNWINPETNKRNSPSTIYLAVKQTFSTVNIRVYTQNSESEEFFSQIVKTNDERYKLISVYQNIPQRIFRDKSPIHMSSFIKYINGESVKSLKGNYWTDRGTAGESYSMARINEYFYSFKEANENLDKFSKYDTFDSVSEV